MGFNQCRIFNAYSPQALVRKVSVRNLIRSRGRTRGKKGKKKAAGGTVGHTNRIFLRQQVNCFTTDS